MGGEARHGCDPPHGAAAIGADEEVTGVALSIAFGVTGLLTRLLAGTQTGLLGSRMNLPYRAGDLWRRGS